MKKRSKLNLGIRAKVMLSSLIIVLVLLLSGVIAFFEFGRMSNYISKLISDNIQSVNISRTLVNISDEYHASLFQEIGRNLQDEVLNVHPSGEMEANLRRLENVLTTDFERDMADSVHYAYAAYMQVAYEAEMVWIHGQEVRMDWYFSELQKVYDKLRGYLQQLAEGSQRALTDNYDNLHESYFRSIVPGIVAISAGIVLVVLFSYFLNIYLLNPILKMSRGLKDYRERRKKYNVAIERGGDQIQAMNEMIRDIVEENKSMKR